MKNVICLRKNYKTKWNYDSIIFTLFFLLFLMLIVLPGNALAYTRGTKLSDLFYTDSFHGNWEVLTKMNWLGSLISLVISAFSFLGLASVAFRFMFTLIYLSNKSLFDNIDEIKSEGRNQKAFGLGALAKSAWQAKYGTGLDALISFGLSLMPNFKAYSEYSTEAKHKNNYNDSDTITSYLLKSALPNIMVVFAFSMGFNGTLWQAYGTVVDAMSVASESFVNDRLSTIVDRAINTGSNYKFAYDSLETKYGDFKQSVMKSIYSNILKKTTDLNTDTKISVGQKVDETFNPIIDYMALKALGIVQVNNNKVVAINTVANSLDYTSGNTSETDASAAKNTATTTFMNGSNAATSLEAITNNFQAYKDSLNKEGLRIQDSQARNLEFSVVVNNTTEYGDAISCKLSDLGVADSDAEYPYYVHVFVTKKATSNEHNYLSIQKDTNTKTSGKEGSTSGTDNNSPTKTLNGGQ